MVIKRTCNGGCFVAFQPHVRHSDGGIGLACLTICGEGDVGGVAV